MDEGNLPVEAAGPADIDLVAAALRADLHDLDAFERVFARAILELLPADVVEIDYERSARDRLTGKQGNLARVGIRLGESHLELAKERGRLVARLSRAVRGVVISSKEVGLDEWTRALAEGLQKLANENATARDALARLLGTT
jgi:hypothetical protein